MENQAVRKSGKKKLSRSQRIRASGDVKAIADLNRVPNRKRKVAKAAAAAKVKEMTPEELKKWRQSKGVFVNPGPIDWEALAKEEEEKVTFQRERMKGRFLGVVADAPQWDRSGAAMCAACRHLSSQHAPTQTRKQQLTAARSEVGALE